MATRSSSQGPTTARPIKANITDTFLPIFYLSDPSPIIGFACHSLTLSLTDCGLVNLIDVTLACEDANSKLIEVVNVDDEDRVGNNLL